MIDELIADKILSLKETLVRLEQIWDINAENAESETLIKKINWCQNEISLFEQIGTYVLHLSEQNDLLRSQIIDFEARNKALRFIAQRETTRKNTANATLALLEAKREMQVNADFEAMQAEINQFLVKEMGQEAFEKLFTQNEQ